MLALFQCVAESVAAKGIGSLAREIPFGSTLLDIAADAWRRFKARKAEADARAEVQRVAQAAADEVKQAAAEAARDAYPDDREKALELELFLTQIPAAVRQSLRRVRSSPYIPHRDRVRGFVYEVENGRLREVTAEG